MAQVRGDSSVAGASAVFGGSVVARGVEGHSTNDHGVVGVTLGPGTGVFGVGTKGRVVEGESAENHAIVGNSKGKGAGVFGLSDSGNGIEGRSTHQVGVSGKGGRLAALFDGDVEVTGDIRLSNADCAEDFDMDAGAIVEPGTVMVIRDDGALRHSERAFDKTVAGVISGAGN